MPNLRDTTHSMTSELAEQRGVDGVGGVVVDAADSGPSAPYTVQSGPTISNGFGNTVWIISILLPKKRSLATP